MNKHIFNTYILLLLVFLSGCAAPGSSIGVLSVEGRLVSTNEEPLKNKKIEFILPAAYGLGGLDLVMNKPEDFGHKDEKFEITTDENGEFKHELGAKVYHVGCWILPPVGCFPKRPPAPFVLVRFDASSNEYYAIDTYSGEFKIYSYEGTEIPLKESLINSISTDSKKGTNQEYKETIGVINIKKRQGR